MKIATKRNKKKIIVIIIAILVLLGGVAAYAYSNKLWPFHSTTINMDSATKAQQENGSKIKQESADAEVNSKPTKSDQPHAPVPQDGKSIVTVSITVANQSGAVLQIRSLIEALSSDGTCTLTLSKGDSSKVVKTAKIQPLASSSTCQGFDIPTSELAKGTWNIDLVFENPTLKGEASRTVTIQ